MKTRKYTCDGGTLSIQCGGVKVSFTNDYGDGIHKVFLLSKDERNHAIRDKSSRFRGAIEVPELSEALVLSYDCTAPNTKITMRLGAGSYGISAIENSGDMLIEQWD